MLVVAELNSSILPRLGMVARFLVARNVMFSGKQTTVRKMADQLKNCINQRAHGFYSNRIHTAGSVWITDTITNVMIHYNTSLNFSFKLSTFYLASILFTWLKFTCANLHSQNRVSGNQPYDRGRRWPRKRCWKSEFAFFQPSSRLLQVTNFVKCRWVLLKVNS